MPRIVILGTGTDVGKTYVTSRLAAALATDPNTDSVAAIKPIESGVVNALSETDVRSAGHAETLGTQDLNNFQGPDPKSDAAILANSSHPAIRPPKHAYAFPDAVSPHLAARKCNVDIDISRVVAWVTDTENNLQALHYHTLHHATSQPNYPAGRRSWTLIETAGAALTPLAMGSTNLDLAQLLEPAIWILVAPDRLGVLHDLTATLCAMLHLGRPPDSIILSQVSDPDASTGSNGHELRELGLADVDVTLGRGAQIPNDYLRRLFQLVAARGL